MTGDIAGANPQSSNASPLFVVWAAMVSQAMHPFNTRYLIFEI
jgi:hypothetical protein